MDLILWNENGKSLGSNCWSADVFQIFGALRSVSVFLAPRTNADDGDFTWEKFELRIMASNVIWAIWFSESLKMVAEVIKRALLATLHQSEHYGTISSSDEKLYVYGKQWTEIWINSFFEN